MALGYPGTIRYRGAEPEDRDPKLCEEMKDLSRAKDFLDSIIESWDEPFFNLLDWHQQAFITIRSYMTKLEEDLEVSNKNHIMWREKALQLKRRLGGVIAAIQDTGEAYIRLEETSNSKVDAKTVVDDLEKIEAAAKNIEEKRK